MNNLSNMCKYFFIVAGILFGFLFLIINPPFQAPDEDAHLFKIWSITEGNFNFDVLNGQKGHIIPKSFSDIEKSFDGMKFDYDVRMKANGFSYLKNIRLDKENKVFHQLNPTEYTVFSYIPAVFILPVLKFLNVNPLYILYILRFCCLLVYLSLIYAAIKITPCYKCLFAVLALIPSAIYIAGAVNTDCLVMGVSFLLIAYTLKLKFDTNIVKISNKQMIIWAILFSFLCTLKYLYFPFILLYLTIPKEKFSTSKKYYKILFFIALTNIIYNIYFIFSVLNHSSVIQNDSTKLDSNIVYLLQNPIQIITNIIVNHTKQLIFHIYMLIAQFGWAPVCIHLYCVLAFYLVIFGTLFHDNEFNFKWRDRLIFLITAFLTFLFVCLSIFVLYGKVDQGMQARYIIPFTPLLFFIFANNKINIQSKLLALLSPVILTIVYIDCIYILISRFYSF